MTKRDAKLVSYLQVNQRDPLSQQATGEKSYADINL